MKFGLIINVLYSLILAWVCLLICLGSFLESLTLWVIYCSICMNITVVAAAAAAKSLQSCPTLCDPIDGSPPGSPVPGILQARTLELPFPSPMHESEKWKWSHSVVSDSSRPHGLQPTGLLCPWDFPGKSTGVGCHRLLRSQWLGRQKSIFVQNKKNWLILWWLWAFYSRLLFMQRKLIWPTLSDRGGALENSSIVHRLCRRADWVNLGQLQMY